MGEKKEESESIAPAHCIIRRQFKAAEFRVLYLVLYVYVLFGALFALLAQVVMIHPRVQASFKSVQAQSLITNRCIRLLCCLPPMKICNIYETVNDTYSVHTDDDSGVVVPGSNLEEMVAEDPLGTGEKEEFAEVVDKFMFAIYAVIYAVLLGYHY
ncbi:hypothetical protein EVAR_34444_1 [Eumeta japonica]|uniref:Uncharacterized protein n=1 Tax=Eumeta variegata TaxID=151549 RepID=A0A4C1WJG3_EUMVA|nr:hypothetical protein EVAR_34444_1 [Eumeta japonica]